jgi:hypothetical protein
MATVTLNWNQPSETLGGVATGYDVWRREITGSFSLPTGVVNSDSNGDISGWSKVSGSTPISPTSYADGSLDSGTSSYAYTVTASNTGGYSDGCVPVSVSGLKAGS